MAHIYSGTSGWVYKAWREHLYQGVPVKRWLHGASRAFSSLEINSSFYSQISPATYARWREATPDGFRFALKGHRFITHYKRLRDCQDPVIRLRDQAHPLGRKLAAVVWQLPSRFTVDIARLTAFLRALRCWHVRHAIEMRHASWFIPPVAAVLRDAGVAVCLGDAPDFPMWREITADFVYVRLHGHTRKYASSYSPASLRRWAADARRWRDEHRDVFLYFDNDAEGHAVHDARAFARLVGAAPSSSPAISPCASSGPEEQSDAAETRAAVEEHGRKCVLIPGDVTDPAFCKRAIDETVRELGGIDLLVSNAAYQNRKRFEELTPEEFDRTFKTNVYAYFYLARHAVPKMERGSCIIATSSETGFEGSELLPDYSATKGAINQLTKVLAKQLAEQGIRVNAVAPGPVWTPLNPADEGLPPEGVAKFGQHTPLGRPAQPEEIAPAYVFLASEADSSFITGIILPALGGETIGG